MSASQIGLEPASPTRIKTLGEKYESIGFTFCKAATICLIAGRFALPAAAGLAALFYVLAFIKGNHDTRCVLRLPLLIAGFWAWIGAVSLYAILNPDGWHSLLAHAWPFGPRG